LPRLLLRDLRDRHGQELALAQELAHLPRRVTLEDALALPASGVESRVLECPHDQSSRVTRRTSSMVVSPRSTLPRPSSRIEGVMVRAYRSSSCSAAPS